MRELFFLGPEAIAVRQHRFVFSVQFLSFHSLGFEFLQVFFLNFNVPVEVGGGGGKYFGFFGS